MAQLPTRLLRHVHSRLVDALEDSQTSHTAVLYGSNNTAARVWNAGGSCGKRILDLSVLTPEVLPHVDAILHPKEGIQEIIITAFEDGDLALANKLPSEARPGLTQWQCPTVKHITVTLFARPNEWIWVTIELIRQNPTLKSLTISAPERPSADNLRLLCEAIDDTGTLCQFRARNRVIGLLAPLVSASFEANRIGVDVVYLEDWLVSWCMSRVMCAEDV